MNYNAGKNNGQYKHGLNRVPEYPIYYAAKGRCDRPNNNKYKDYGGRGIEFRFNNFQEFINHIGRRPSKGMILDRINNNGHYEIGNVRWISPSESAFNRRMKKTNTSGLTGVYWNKALQKWQAAFCVNRTQTHLGFFENKFDAFGAYTQKYYEINKSFPANYLPISIKKDTQWL